jgi:site-specific DNA-adenine methylase
MTYHTHSREIDKLAKWLDSMLEKIYQEHHPDLLSFYEKLQVIYSGSILELKRQLSQLSHEQSEFVDKMWFSFNQQSIKVVERLTHLNIETESNCLKEINRLHTLY